MIKSTLVKWAVAAMLAVPAVPMFGKTIHHRLVTRTQTHRALTVKPRRVVTHTHRHVTLSKKHKLTSLHRASGSHRLVRKTSLRRVSTTSNTHFKVHVTKMPPTIDGINT
jgi:hypothetical protein